MSASSTQRAAVRTYNFCTTCKPTMLRKLAKRTTHPNADKHAHHNTGDMMFELACDAYVAVASIGKPSPCPKPLTKVVTVPLVAATVCSEGLLRV